MKRLQKFLLIAFLVVFTCICGGFFYYFAVTYHTVLQPEKLELSNVNVRIFDEINAPVQTQSTLKQSCPIQEIPEITKRTFISTEDKRFLTHHGFDYARILKAAAKNASAHALKQGASTISQQLIKNTHLSQEKTFKRKLREWKLTRALEKKYTKNEILEKYLNVIYFGHNCFGIRAAASFYFHKSPNELDLADSAILAGLVKSPNNYSPFKNAKLCQKRKNAVLNLMRKNGVITESEYVAALQKELPNEPYVSKQNDGYLQGVFDELTDISERFTLSLSGDVRIYTYLQQNVQQKAETLAAGHVDTDKAFIVLSPKTGGIKAYVSTAYNARRLPGSLLKPLLVYAPCIEENILSPATPILDEKINYGGYSPKNYDDTFHGYVSAKESLAKSYNVPAVKCLETLGLDTGEQYLQKMRLSIDETDKTLALALGGMQNGFTLPSLAGAYTTLANDGIYNGAAFISKIDVNGQCVYERKTENERVFSAETAFLTTDMLQTAVKEGTAKKLRGLPFDIAAKTGTVGVKAGNTDAYALSYTTSDIVGVWLGNADNSFMHATGGGLPCNYARELNEYLYSEYQRNTQTIAPFPTPKTVQKITLDKVSYTTAHCLRLADEYAPKEYCFSEWFKKENIPLEKSDYFSAPKIAEPTLRVIDKKVNILLDNNCPTFYRYKIERCAGKENSIIYDGGFITEFIDDTLSTNTKYRYFITPIYGNREGEKIELPSVYIQQTTTPTIPKEWWRD